MNQLLQEAIHLPEDQRLTLVNMILKVGENYAPEDVELAWDIEVRDRIARYDHGESGSRPAEEVFSDIDRRLKS